MCSRMSDGRLDTHVDPDDNGDWVDPAEYVYLTGEGFEDLTPSELVRYYAYFGLDGTAIARGEVVLEDDEADAEPSTRPIEQLDK